MFREFHDINDVDMLELFTSFTDSAWALETLPLYQHRHEQEALALFLTGDTVHLAEHMASWTDTVVAPAVEHGRYIGRVRVLEHATDAEGRLLLSDYVRFELACYTRARQAGEELRIAWHDPGKWIRGVWSQGSDFWLFDAETEHGSVLEMQYSDNGVFRKAVHHTSRAWIERARKCQKAALKNSRPFYP